MLQIGCTYKIRLPFSVMSYHHDMPICVMEVDDTFLLAKINSDGSIVSHHIAPAPGMTNCWMQTDYTLKTIESTENLEHCVELVNNHSTPLLARIRQQEIRS